MDILSDILKDKSVALVGPAKYLTGKGWGNEIDQHDIVVRLNRGMELTEKYSKDVGTKTDILYSCLIEKPENAGTIDVEVLKNNNVKVVCAPPQSSMKGYAPTTSLSNLVKDDTIEKILQQGIPLRIIDHDINNFIANKVKCRPNTGYLSIYDLLRFKPKKMSIYGFSFYLDGFMPGAKAGIEKNIGLSENEFTDKCFSSKRHVQENLWSYAKETLPFTSSITLDPILKEILNMQSFHRGNLLNFMHKVQRNVNN